MDYYYKYHKYKTKYIKLNNLSMNGGGKVPFQYIKNINLFPVDSDIEKYLNPIYGFIWNESGAINNYYNFNYHNNINKLVLSSFYKINDIIQPTKPLFYNVKPGDLGKLLGYTYLYKIKLQSTIDKINNVINYIEKITPKLNSMIKFKLTSSNSRNITTICDNFKLIKDEIKILKDSNYQILSIDNIVMNVSLINNNNQLYNFLEKYLKDLKKHKKDLITDFETKNNIIYSSKNAEKYINDIIIRKGNFSIKNNIEIDLFHVILAIVWWVSDNKNGIKEYYEGINTFLLNENKVIIPATFLTDIYTIDELDNRNINDFYYGLASAYKLYKGSMHLYTQEYTISCCTTCPTYPDCGETSIRNFINIITYDVRTNNFDISILKKLNATEKLIEYYTKFNNIILQSSENKVSIFNTCLNARDAWSKLVSNLPDVEYNKHSQHDCHYLYEIMPRFTIIGNGEKILNILQVLKNLFLNINEWNDFEKNLDNKITLDTSKMDNFGHGIIKMTTELGNYNWSFLPNHFTIDKINTDLSKFNLTSLSNEQKFYIEIFNSTIDELIETPELIKHKFNWYYFKNYSKDDLINLINYYSNEISNKDYTSIFDYIYKWDDNDRKKRIFINFKKITDISVYDLNVFNIEYNELIKKNKINIIKYTVVSNTILGDSLEELTNLQTLIFYPDFNQKLGNSLKELTNLQTLEFNKSNEQLISNSGFNQEFDDSLSNLTNLKTLILGNSFDKNLGNSLNNLTNLQNLTFGNSFDKNLGNSLNNLTNLQTLKFGYNFRHEIADSLKNLINLQTLEFGVSFDKELGESLVNLKNLKNIILHTNYKYKKTNKYKNITSYSVVMDGEWADW